MSKYIKCTIVDIHDDDDNIINNYKDYLPVVCNEDDKATPSISQSMVESFIKDIYVSTLGNKTTILKAVLANNYVIVESSSCVDDRYYDIDIGKQQCLKRLYGRVGELLGFLLCSAVNGFDKDKGNDFTEEEIL